MSHTHKDERDKDERDGPPHTSSSDARRSVRVVRGRGAAAGCWVVEALMPAPLHGHAWRQAALPDRTREQARETAAVVREHGALLGA